MKKLALVAKLKKFFGKGKFSRTKKALAMLRRGGKKLQAPADTLRKKVSAGTQAVINTSSASRAGLVRKLKTLLNQKLGD